MQMINLVRQVAPVAAACLGAAVLMLGCGTAWAACGVVTFVPTSVDVGSQGASALPAADVAGYKRAGTSAVSLRASCDDVPDARQISFDSLLAGDTAGLVRWGSAAAGASTAGAARLTVQQASVGGVAVPMTFTPTGGAVSAATQGPLALTGNGVLGLDLRGVPSTGNARKSLALTMQIQTLVKSSFVPTTSTPFRTDMGVSVP